MPNKKTKRYFTGTTLECAIKILEEGTFRIDPPGRVWKNYSGRYVYCIDPGMVKTELEYETGYRAHAFTLASEQAAFAVYQFEHSRRVVFEVELERERCEYDPDCGCAIRYPENVPASAIRNIFVEKRDTSQQLIEATALSLLFREGVDSVDDLEEWEDYCEQIKGLSLVEPIYWSDLQIRYDELSEWFGERDYFKRVNLCSWDNHLKKLA